MELFLSGVLSGSPATRQRHLRQATDVQTAIAKRWQRDNPWTWQRKHLIWFLDNQISHRADSTRYNYQLTVRLITMRLGKAWSVPV
jgi:hypothetical protein|nr:hypothetical protein [Pseudomonas fluorescens]